jgi:hypothetical protein
MTDVERDVEVLRQTLRALDGPSGPPGFRYITAGLIPDNMVALSALARLSERVEQQREEIETYIGLRSELYEASEAHRREILRREQVERERDASAKRMPEVLDAHNHWKSRAVAAEARVEQAERDWRTCPYCAHTVEWQDSDPIEGPCAGCLRAEKAEAERDRLQHRIDCADTPLMRAVMGERDRLRAIIRVHFVPSQAERLLAPPDAAEGEGQ